MAGLCVMEAPQILWRPNDGPQVEALQSMVFELLFGGRRGGGKSETMLADSLNILPFPGAAGIAFRRTYPELEQLIARSFKFYTGLRRGAWNGTSRTWHFPGGVTIKFRHLKDSNAYRQYLGHEYQWMLLEELTSFLELEYHQLKGSCRSTIPGLVPTMRSTTNPGGPGHAWVKEYFVDVCPPGQVYTDPETGLTRQYLPCPMAPQIMEIDPGYVARLMQLPEADRKAWLDGDWDAYTGSVFKLERGIHVWSRDEFKQRTGHDEIPADWLRFRVMDWGYAKPFACYWIAVDYNGRGYVYREYYGVARDSKGATRANVGLQLEPTTAAVRIADLERGEKIATAWTGPDLFSAGTGDTTAGIRRSEYFSRQGVFFAAWEAGPDSRKAKKAALHERLHYERDEAGAVIEWPGLIFLADATPHAQRTIPALEYDPARGGEDVDSSGEDHCYDAIAGWCLMRPWTPKKPKGPEGWRDRVKKPTGWM